MSRIHKAVRWTGLVCMVPGLLAGAAQLRAASILQARPTDAAAVYVERGSAVKGNGIADDTEAMQAAINRVQETSGQGIVFVGEGKYRLTHTLLIWPGVRLIGYGANRPAFVLGANTPGYGTGMAYMVMFTGGRSDGPRPDGRRRPTSAAPFAGVVPARVGIIDANPGTFYSALSNIDFEIGPGNAGAVGVRSHYAQHCFLAHIDFHLGSGMAGIHDAGNEAEDLHFFGGDYGIFTGKPSPGWQFTLLDSSFDGQRKAAIQEHEAGLTLVHDTVSNTPKAVEIDPGYADELWVQNSRFENIRDAAITVGNESNARTEINVRNVSCSNVPVFAHFRESGKNLPGGTGSYSVQSFSHGLTMKGAAGSATIETGFAKAPAYEPEPEAAVIRSLPPQALWTDVRSLGVKGDGTADDTDAILNAIRTHDVLYLPTGRYRVTRTVALRQDTVLIGMHPSTTQIFLEDKSERFRGAGGPVPLLLAPAGGHNIVQGIGLYTGGSNNRASGAMWLAGADSLMDDVRFLGGHGTNNPDGSRVNPYNANHTGDPDPAKAWDAQFPSLWVLNGGGGVFADIWTPDTFAQAGMYVSNTTTPGRVYELSSEHHVRSEIKLDHTANWQLVALQTEEESGEGPRALPLEIESSRNILVANFHSYRVVSSRATAPYAVRVANSDGIEFRNLHIDSDSKVSFDDGVYDETSGASERYRELATLDVAAATPKAPRPAAAAVPVATGFNNISGATVDPQGRVLFVDYQTCRIYRYTPGKAKTEVLRDAPIDAVNLAADGSGNILAISYTGNGTVFSFNSDDPASDWAVVPATKSQGSMAGKELYLPADHWEIPPIVHGAIAAKAWVFASPGGSALLPAGQDFVSGELYYGIKMSDVLRSFGLQKTRVGQRFYMTDEEQQKTYVGTVAVDGGIENVRLFAERGGEGVTTDAAGNVYIAAGQIFVYRPDGTFVREIDVPERPIDLVCGDKDRRTLFILARTSLYSMPL